VDLVTERAERIRCNVAGRRIRASVGEVHVTASIGVAYGAPQWPINALSLIQAADDALYQAKSEGRNCVVLGQHPSRPASKETQSVELLTSL
jgi:diguanylate cyclase (GGDEF)-like protein